MMANQSCQEMVLMREMPQSLRQELMRGMKRKRSKIFVTRGLERRAMIDMVPSDERPTV
jgi:hypothetical protein